MQATPFADKFRASICPLFTTFAAASSDNFGKCPALHTEREQCAERGDDSPASLPYLCHMVRFVALSLALLLLTPAATPARAAGAGFTQEIFTWLFGGPDPDTVEQTSARRPKVWTLHPADRSRHPEARRPGLQSSGWLAPLRGKHFFYDGGPSRGLSVGVTTPHGAIVRQGRPSLSRGIRRGRVGTQVRRSFN